MPRSFGLQPLMMQPFGIAPQRPATNPMMPPEEMFQPFDEQSAALEQQIALAQALRRQQAPQHSTGLGGLFGAMGSTLNGMTGGIQEAQARSAQDILLKKKGAAEAQKFGLMQAIAAEQAAKKEALEREKMAAEQARHGAALKSKAADDKDKKSRDLREQADGLRKEWTGLPEIKAFKEVESAYSNIKNAAAKPSAAGDQSLVFSFMKMLDPGSSVREGEFANAAAAAGLGDRMIAMMKKVDSGQLLTPGQRQDFINQAETLFNSRKAQASRATDFYRKRATEGGLNPDDVTMDFGGGAAKPQAVAAPKTLVEPVQIQTDDDYDKLPPGAEYIDPEGNRRTKK
jgi:hypothetical protein